MKILHFKFSMHHLHLESYISGDHTLQGTQDLESNGSCITLPQKSFPFSAMQQGCQSSKQCKEGVSKTSSNCKCWFSIESFCPGEESIMGPTPMDGLAGIHPPTRTSHRSQLCCRDVQSCLGEPLGSDSGLQLFKNTSTLLKWKKIDLSV